MVGVAVADLLRFADRFFGTALLAKADVVGAVDAAVNSGGMCAGACAGEQAPGQNGMSWHSRPP